MAARDGRTFDGKYCYFIYEIKGWGNSVGIGTCNADDHWEALRKFETGVGCSGMRRGRTYEVRRNGHDGPFCMKFVW